MTAFSQRFSLRLSVERVAAVAKVARGVPRGDRRDRTADGLKERHARSGFGLPKERLELAEGLLDGREVRRVWRQVNQRAASRLHEGPDPLAPVGAPRLSMTTTWPGLKDGASTRST